MCASVIRQVTTEFDAESQNLHNDEDDHCKRQIQINQLKRQSSFKSIILRRIYILTWIRSYNKTMAISDLIAGVTLGMTMIPQAIAYAALANLPSQYGLYAAFMGSLIYVFFGTIKEVSIGPTSLMAILTLQYTLDKPAEFAVILGFLSGCIELLMGIFKLGFIVDFISVPVTSAFTTSTSLIIIGSQLKSLFGITYSSKGFADSIYALFVNIRNSKLGDSLLGLICCIFLLCLKQINQIEIKERRILKKIIWYISISRNAIIVFVTSCIAFYWISGSPPFALSGNVKPGIPKFNLPPFEIQYDNRTLSFTDVCWELGSGIFVVPLVAVLANVAIAKSFSSSNAIDASQEMLTLGICNILGSCVQSMPTCGAFTRSAVSHASGVRTPLAGIYSGVITILALSVLTPYFYYIPKATLSSVLIVAVVFMVDFKIPLKLWKSNRRDFFAWISCLLACLAIGVELGLLFGILLNISYLLFIWARPNIIVKIACIENMNYIKVITNVGMFYPGIDYLREKVNLAASDTEFKIPILIDCSKFTGLDYTSIHGFTSLANDLQKQNQILILVNLNPNLHNSLANSSIKFCSSDEYLKNILIENHVITVDVAQNLHASNDTDRKINK